MHTGDEHPGDLAEDTAQPTEFSVILTTTASFTYVVTANDGDYETVIEEATQEAPSSVCAQCSGWGRTGRFLELGDDWEPVAVTETADASEVWTAPRTDYDHAIGELRGALAELTKAGAPDWALDALRTRAEALESLR